MPCSMSEPLSPQPPHSLSPSLPIVLGHLTFNTMKALQAIPIGNWRCFSPLTVICFTYFWEMGKQAWLSVERRML